MAGARCRAPKYRKVVWTDGLFKRTVEEAIKATGEGVFIPTYDELSDRTYVFEYNGTVFRIKGKALATQIAHRGGFRKLAEDMSTPNKRAYMSVKK